MGKYRKIHVLIVVRHPAGGIRTFIRYVYSKFDNENYKLTLLLSEGSELDMLKENLKTTDCEFVTLDQSAGVLVFIKKLLGILNNSNIDIVHSNGFTSMVFSVIPVCLYLKPHFLTAHDVFTEKQFIGLKGLIKRAVVNICFHFVDAIHFVSHDAQDNFLSYFPAFRRRRAKLVVIPNGIEVERFLVEGQEDWRKQIGLGEETFLIGFLGRFMAQKGFKHLVDAIDIILSMNNDMKPVVLTFGWGDFIREEQVEIKRRGLESNFHFLSFQENPARAMKGVDVVVMPSLWEAYGLLAAEAMVAGVPIIGSDCIGLREVLRDTPARIVPTADSKALAEAIIAEIQSSSKEKMEQFRGKAIQRYNVSNQIQSLKSLINEIVDKK